MSTPTKFVPITHIHVRPDRQRTEFDTEKMRDLETSILSKGLLHPIGIEVHPEYPDQYFLVYGERRLKSVTALYKGDHTIHFSGSPVDTNLIPAVVYPELTPLLRAELELEENIRRDDITWQERVKAMDAIAKMHPELTKQALAETLSPKLGLSPESTAYQLTRASVIAENMHLPAVAKARSQTEAYRVVLKNKEDSLAAQLNQRAKVANVPDLAEVMQGDLLKVLPALSDNTFDMIFADPPYGLSADTAFGQKVETKHHYKDDEDTARQLAKAIIEQGFRITKPRAHLFIFCKPLLFHHLHEMSKAMLWAPFPFPIIWQKGPGYAPWGNLGFRSNYEMLFWASKGQRGLNFMVENIINVPTVKAEREHGAQKPIDLLTKIIEAATSPGDAILDPCCGSGSTLVAARRLKRRSLGVELSNEYYLLAKSRILEEANGANQPGTTDENPGK